MKTKIHWFIVISLLLLPIEATHAKITMTTSGSMTYQGIRSEDSMGSRGEEPSFAHPLVNFNVDGSFDDGIGLHAEVYSGIRSRTGADTGLDTFRIGELYGTSGSWFDPITFRGGKIEIPFGRNYLTRSDHGDVQRNPLIGNHLPDIHAQQLGAEMAVDYRSTVWTIAVTNGTDQFQLNPSRGTGIVADLRYDLPLDFSLNLSGYRVRHGDTTADRASDELATSNLFGTDQDRQGLVPLTSLQSPAGDPYTGINTGLGISPDAFVFGRNVRAWQLDIDYEPTSELSATGFYGTVDDDLDGLIGTSNTVEWTYYSIQAVYNPRGMDWKLATRFGEMDANSLTGSGALARGIQQNGKIKRFQLGFNYRFTDNVLAKAEFVRGYEDVTTRQLEYNGIIFEISAAGLPKLNPGNLSGKARQKF